MQTSKHECGQCMHDFGRAENLRRHLSTGCKGLPSPPFQVCDVCCAFVKGSAFHLKRHKSKKAGCLDAAERAAYAEQQRANRRAKDVDRHRAARAASRLSRGGESVVRASTDEMLSLDLGASSVSLEELIADITGNPLNSDVGFETDTVPVHPTSDMSLFDLFQNDGEDENAGQTQSDDQPGEIDGPPDESDHAPVQSQDSQPAPVPAPPRPKCNTCDKPVGFLFSSGRLCEHIFHPMCFGNFNNARGLEPSAFICPVCEKSMPANRDQENDAESSDNASSDGFEMLHTYCAEDFESDDDDGDSGSVYNPSDDE